MNRYPDITYYLLPVEDVTDEMVDEAIQTSRDTLRVSVRPIKGQMYTVLKFNTANREPECMRPYRGLMHPECLEELNSELCRRIRNGDFNLKTPGLFDHVWETTLTKVAIDQPKYSAYQQAINNPAK